MTPVPVNTPPLIYTTIYMHTLTNTRTHRHTLTHKYNLIYTPCKQQNWFYVTLKIQTKIRISQVSRKSLRIDYHAFKIGAQLPTLAKTSHTYTNVHKYTRKHWKVGTALFQLWNNRENQILCCSVIIYS